MKFGNVFLITVIFIFLTIELSNAKNDCKKQVNECYVTISYEWQVELSDKKSVHFFSQIMKFSSQYFNNLFKKNNRTLIGGINFFGYSGGKFVIWYAVPCNEVEVWSNELIRFLKSKISENIFPDVMKILNITKSDKEFNEPMEPK
jgi:hypothetical protein